MSNRAASSIPDGFIEIFHCIPPSSHTMVLGST